MTLTLDRLLTADDFETGCVLDRSHVSADDLNRSIIDLAQRCGRTTECPDDCHTMTEEDFSEFLTWESEQALNWLNDWIDTQVDERRFWVEDNSLFLAQDQAAEYGA